MEKVCKYKDKFPDYLIRCENICEKHPKRKCCLGCKDFILCDKECQFASRVWIEGLKKKGNIYFLSPSLNNK